MSVLQAERTLSRAIRRPSAEAWIFAGLAVLLAVAVFANDWGLLTFDTKPELYLAPWDTLQRYLSAWRPDPHLGTPNYHIGFAPVVAVVALIQSAGIEAWAAARVLRFGLLLLGGWGAVRLFNELAEEHGGPAGRITAAAVFVANPHAIVSGATLPVLLPYAFLPWMVLAFLRTLRRPGSWRPPAAFAIAFFLMGGMNAGVLPLLQLLALPAVMGYERLINHRRLRSQLGGLLRCGLLTVFVSLYWLVPTALSSGAGADVAINTERPEHVASTTSYSESLRLLGMWTMYGRFFGRLLTETFADYLINLWAVVATFAIPVLAAVAALASRARARLLAVLLLALSVPVMVGMFPPSSPTPFGRALQAAFQQIPAAMAFRTTNKAGSVAALAVTLLLALGMAALWRRRASLAPSTRGGLIVGLTAVVAGASLPAWTGNLHPESLPIPDYWHEAALDIDAGPQDHRVLFLPGQSLARYRWGHEGVDDLDGSLFTRPVVWRPTVPAGSPEAANFLTGVDVPLNQGALPRGALPIVARYLGADDILVRHDTEWERVGSARPAALAALVEVEDDLERAARYGEPGQFTRPESGAFGVDPEPIEGELPPLERYRVADPRPIVRAESVAGTLLVDGDNFALPAMAGAGLLDRQPAYRLLGGMAIWQLEQALDDGARVVMTDTNRRRDWDVQKTGDGYSVTLQASDQVDAGRTRTLYDDPDRQTVTVLEGVKSVTATASGSPFGPSPIGRPEFAFDGETRTAWIFGAFNTVGGQSLTVEFEQPQTISRITLRPYREQGAQIAKVRLQVGETELEVPVPDESLVEATFPPTETSSVTLEVTGVRGEGGNPVGFREIDVPGVRVAAVARLPQTLSRLAENLSPDYRDRLARAPLDILLTRQAGKPDVPGDDEESRLERMFTLPAERRFEFSGTATVGDLSDLAIDELAGVEGPVRAWSSSRLLDAPDLRASQALDGRSDTAWAPNFGGIGEWIQVELPPEEIDHVVIVQEGPGEVRELITAVDLDFGDGEPPLRAELDGPVARVGFPVREVERLRVTVTRTQQGGGQVRISELRVGSARMPALPPDTPLTACTPMMNINGFPVNARLEGTVADLERASSLPLRSCEGLELGEGEHRLRAGDGWLIDNLRLRSGGRGSRPAPAPETRLVASEPSRFVADIAQADAPYYLSSGQAFDERWTATTDGRSLGPPIVVNGYAAGWRVDDLDAKRVVIAYGPQDAVVVTRWVSVGGLALCLGLVLPPRLLRGRGKRLTGLGAPFRRTWVMTCRFAAQRLTHQPARVRSPLRRTRLLSPSWPSWWPVAVGGALSTLLLFALLGPVGAALGLAVGAWHAIRPPRPRVLLLVAVGVLAAVPLAWLSQGVPTEETVSPAIVTERMLAHYLAATGLLLLVVGVIRDVLPRRGRGLPSVLARVRATTAAERGHGEGTVTLGDPPAERAQTEANGEEAREEGNGERRAEG